MAKSGAHSFGSGSPTFVLIAVESLEATKSGIYFVSKGLVREVACDEKFDPSPEVFGLVQVRGVAGQRKQSATDSFD